MSIFTQENYSKNIIDKLSWLEAYVKNTNILNFYDGNIVAENFFATFFSILYNTNYKNGNLYEKNLTSIDIINDEQEIAIQVSSDNTSTKIKETISKFEKNKYYRKYKLLKFLFLKQKKKYRISLEKSNYQIEVMDISDICNEIKRLDIDTLEKLDSYVQKAFVDQSQNELIKSLVLNTEDIKDIIDFLSSENVIDNIDDSRNNFKEYPGLNEKNKINNLDTAYFENIILPYLPNFQKMEDFLKNPRNTSYCEKYYDVAAEIKNKLLTRTNSQKPFEEILVELYDNITQNITVKRKKLVWFILYYMYCQCDIGRSK